MADKGRDDAALTETATRPAQSAAVVEGHALPVAPVSVSAVSDWTVIREALVALRSPRRNWEDGVRERNATAALARLEVRQEAMERVLAEIEGLDEAEWHSGSGWLAVQFIQTKVTRALAALPTEDK